MKIHAPDLTQRPPRSPRVRLGGFVILPRMLDKGRATLAGKAGEFHFNCPLDQQFLNFAGIDPRAIEKATGLGQKRRGNAGLDPSPFQKQTLAR